MENEKNKTYAEIKTDILHQLGYKHVKKQMFDGLSDTQIDNKARSIILSPPKWYYI